MPTPSAPNAPAGTFPPGTVITCGNHTCTVERYLSEGGFAHVYLVRLAKDVDGTNYAVLKRVAVADKEALANMRIEVETMKRLKGHRHVVKYIDSHASHLKGGGYEVFLLMEFCSGGGLIDFMNTRLQNRLTEPEVLNIFSDVAEGVACMHYLEPPLLHRDLKIENILITPNPRRYKLCDFGSSAPVRPAGKSVVECRALEEDIQKHTTMQYRSPEMIDVFKGIPIDEKSDIWALGVLLYKLCYYTTPFEGQGQLAILNASFKYPPYPVFSDHLKHLIGAMLQEKPSNRPNIYEVLSRVCTLRGTDIPIKNIYVGRRPLLEKKTQETIRPVTREQHQSLPPVPTQSYQPNPAIHHPASVAQDLVIPENIPQMRRGRPPKSSNYGGAGGVATSQAQREAVGGDPFAALDKKGPSSDELGRFPTVEQFSLAHDSGTKFDFLSLSPPATAGNAPKEFQTSLTQKMTEKTAAPKNEDFPSMQRIHHSRSREESRTAATASHPVGLGTNSRSEPHLAYKANNTASEISPSTTSGLRLPLASIPYRHTPDGHVSQAPPTERYTAGERLDVKSRSQNELLLQNAAGLPTDSRTTASYTRTQGPAEPDFPTYRSKNTHIESDLDFLRIMDTSVRLPGQVGAGTVDSTSTGRSSTSTHIDHIESNVDFLRALQHESDNSRGTKFDKRGSSLTAPSSKQSKRASVPSANVSNTAKNMLSGRFGDAFRKFENNEGEIQTEQSGVMGDADGRGSWEVTSHEIPQEMKREMEKRQLAEEDRRVEAAAAEYKRNVAGDSADRGAQGTFQKRQQGRADIIQQEVVAMLEEEGRNLARPSMDQHKQLSSISAPLSSRISSSTTTATNTSSSSSSSSRHPSHLHSGGDITRQLGRLNISQDPHHFRPQSAQGVLMDHGRSHARAHRAYERPSLVVPDRQMSSTAAPTLAVPSRRSHRSAAGGPPKPAPKPDKLRAMTPANDSIYMRSSLRSAAHQRPHMPAHQHHQQPQGRTPDFDHFSTSPEKMSFPTSPNYDDDSIDMFKRRFPSL